MDEELQKIVAKFASDVKHWIEVKKILEEDIQTNQELIKLIDKKIKEYESKMTTLN